MSEAKAAEKIHTEALREKHGVKTLKAAKKKLQRITTEHAEIVDEFETEAAELEELLEEIEE